MEFPSTIDCNDTAGRNGPERATLATRRVELDSCEVSDCAYVAVVEAPIKWRVCSGHLTVVFSRVLHCPQDRVVRSRVVSLPVLGTI